MTPSFLFFAILTVVSLVDANYCNVKSCSQPFRKGPHTVCMYRSPAPSRVCGNNVKSIGLTQSEINELLNAHNHYRDLVASGRERRGLRGPQPPGHIPHLKWDTELAAIAQRWANQCQFKHDRCRDVSRFQVGQNIAFRGWSGGYSTTTLSGLVKNWYDEVEKFDRQNIYPFQYTYETAHYTQLVWAQTTHVGCGVVRYKKANGMYTTHLVCNYGPAGNMNKGRMY